MSHHFSSLYVVCVGLKLESLLLEVSLGAHVAWLTSLPSGWTPYVPHDLFFVLPSSTKRVKLAILHQSKRDRLITLRLENKRIRQHLKNISPRTTIWVLKALRYVILRLLLLVLISFPIPCIAGRPSQSGRSAVQPSSWKKKKQSSINNIKPTKAKPSWNGF